MWKLQDSVVSRSAGLPERYEALLSLQVTDWPHLRYAQVLQAIAGFLNGFA
jgi:hypothetical protein